LNVPDEGLNVPDEGLNVPDGRLNIQPFKVKILESQIILKSFGARISKNLKRIAG
jgi:hypothetical protein